MYMWRVAIVNFGYNHFQKLCGQQYLRHLFNRAFLCAGYANPYPADLF